MENSEMRVGAVTNVKEAKILKMPLPEIHDDEVLVRIHTCALCTFEQRIFTGEKKVPLFMPNSFLFIALPETIFSSSIAVTAIFSASAVAK